MPSIKIDTRILLSLELTLPDPEGVGFLEEGGRMVVDVLDDDVDGGGDRGVGVGHGDVEAVAEEGGERAKEQEGTRVGLDLEEIAFFA